MNQLASSPDSSQEEIYRLANSALCGDISAAEWQRLEQLVAGDPLARRWYVEFICDACNIRPRASSPARRTDFPVPPVSQPDPRTASPQTALPFGFLGNALHGTVGYFSSGWPVAYLIATVIFGVGLLIGSHIYVSQPEQVARQSSLPSRMDAEAKIEPVGRITGMVDCAWEQSSEIPNSRDPRPKTQDHRRSRRQVRPGLRPDGNHLRRGRQGHPAGPGYVRGRIGRGWVSLGRQTDGEAGVKGRKSLKPKPKTEDPSPKS